MKSRWMSVVLTFSLALNFGVAGVWIYHVSHVRPRLLHEREREGGEARWAPLRQELGLRDAQIERFMVQSRAMRQEFEQVRLGAVEARERYMRLLVEPEVDPKAVEGAMEEALAGQMKLRRQMYEGMRRFCGSLDAEQRARLRDMMQRRAPERGPMPQPPGAPPQPAPQEGMHERWRGE